jgi:RNA polymerase sigma-70 factor, ECF subfamily
MNWRAEWLTETVEELLRSLDEPDRPIVTLALQGYSASEISEQVKRSERSVYRILERIRKKLERMRSEG